ncbi:uncharacterized protein ARB_04372 [Trichophyton benhamiae CBS 112371]|uniref:Vacuolar ATP synthase subunit D n=1 Tax=Arthroderma benhamiae (strain ATCC MYA-4681 / CBS 112371) TaxID=663331 RepID=D4AJC3_ARTBC|nr:uncharacterized protein ARB_04372 [Trichophyton benhamiae CBS 112371]EFE36846.1 hypothetical protein ARB_04372 [Trichophyton benhamiae CBS 112371]
MKGKLKGAEQGHSLLKRKSEALTKRNSDFSFLLEITRRIDDAKRKMGRVMQIAAFSLAEVTYAVGGDIGFQVQESAKQARFRIRTKQENVSGVLLPQFESLTTDGNNDFGLTGLGKGGQQVQRCRETYARAVETLVELASLQTAFVILDEVIKVVNRRVAILTNIHADINSELDELDREEFYRLKKVIYPLLAKMQQLLNYAIQVSNKKQRDTAALDAEIKAKQQKQGARNKEDGAEPSDMLADADEDVIF